MVAGLRIWQSPTAYADAVIYNWQQRLEAAEFRQSVRLIDCFAAGWSDDAHEVNFLCHQLQACIAAGCTPLTQVTDTLFAKPAKDAAKAEKETLRMELIQKAELEEVQPKLLCKEPEVLRVAGAMHAAMVKLNEKTDGVLKEARKTGWLSWRPVEGVLKRADKESWAKKLVEGSYKLDKAYWHDRYSWLSPTGVPQLPAGEKPELPLEAGDLEVNCFALAEADLNAELDARKRAGYPDSELGFGLLEGQALRETWQALLKPEDRKELEAKLGYLTSQAGKLKCEHGNKLHGAVKKCRPNGWRAEAAAEHAASQEAESQLRGFADSCRLGCVC